MAAVGLPYAFRISEKLVGKFCMRNSTQVQFLVLAALVSGFDKKGRPVQGSLFFKGMYQ